MAKTAAQWADTPKFPPSHCATVLRSRIGPVRAKQLNVAGYGFVGVSIIFFVVAGFRSQR